ncbi:hypothetical protein [Cryptosporangium sp. NPDC051539]|uniref:hypothetical protein n=1 Tax=Cryptosporangium sp. NPDC051539 TaxID=3363962 RepID=UPI00378F66D1
MRKSVKRVTVAIAGAAIAGSAVLAAAPAAEAATVTGHTATISAGAPSTAIAGRHRNDDDDDCCYGGDRGYYKYKHHRTRWHHKRYGDWREYRRFNSYSEAWSYGSRYDDDRWDDFNCRREGNVYVLVVRSYY